MKQKIISYFELNKPYQFEVTDLTALIYVMATICTILEINTAILFISGSLISTATCWKSKRINLIILNASLLLFNILVNIK